MINVQLGGNALSLQNTKNILNNIETDDDINSIFINLEEENIDLMSDFIDNNNKILKDMSVKNNDSLEYLHKNRFLIINNFENFQIKSSQVNVNLSQDIFQQKLHKKSLQIKDVGFSTINPDDDDDNIDNLMLNKIRLFGNEEKPLFKKIDNEIKRRQRLKLFKNEKISKAALAKLLEIDRNNRDFETKAKNAQLFNDRLLMIKKYAIKTFALGVTIGVGIVAIPYFTGPKGLIETLRYILDTHFTEYLSSSVVENLGGNPKGDISFEMAKILTNMVKNHQIKIVFSVYTILSAGAESKGDVLDHLGLMLNATKEESKNIVKGFITFSMTPLVQNQATGMLSELMKNSQFKSPLAFTFLGKLSGYIARDVTTFLLEKTQFFEPANKIKDKEKQDKLRDKNAADIKELDNLFKEKSEFSIFQEKITKEYNHLSVNNPKITAAIGIVSCLGMSNLLLGIANYSWDGLTEGVGEYMMQPMDNFFGISFFNETFLKGFIKKLFTTETIFEHFKRNYVIPFLRTQLREIINLDAVWYENYFAKTIKDWSGYSKKNEWKSWKELNSDNFVKKVGCWLFIYIFDLPKRYLEEESINVLASCISNEKKFGGNSNCNNLYDIASKLSTYEGEELMRHLIKNPLFDQLHTMFVSDDDYNRLNIDVRLIKLMKEINENMIEKLDNVHNADFFRALENLVPRDRDDRDEFISKIFYMYTNPKNLKQIDRYSIQVRKTINNYLSNKDVSRFEGEYWRPLRQFTSETVVNIIEDIVPKDLPGRNEMIKNLANRFSDPFKDDEAIVYGQKALKNVRKNNQKNIDFLLQMDNDLKKIDKLNRELGNTSSSDDDSKSEDDVTVQDKRAEIKAIKHKYELSYSDVKNKIYKLIYNDNSVPPNNVRGELLKKYADYLKSKKLPVSLIDNILSNINNTEGKLNFKDSIIFHKVENLDKNDRNLKNKFYNAIKEALSKIAEDSKKTYLKPTSLRPTIRSSSDDDGDGSNIDDYNSNDKGNSKKVLPNIPLDEDLKIGDNELDINPHTREQLKVIKEKLIEIRELEIIKNQDDIPDQYIFSVNEDIDIKYDELSKLIDSTEVKKILDSNPKISDFEPSDKNDENLMRLSLLLKSIRHKKSIANTEVTRITRESKNVSKDLYDVNKAITDLESRRAKSNINPNLENNIKDLTDIKIKLVNRLDYLRNQLDKNSKLSELYSSQYSELIGAKSDGFQLIEALELNDDDKDLSGNIKDYLDNLNDKSISSDDEIDSSDIPTNVDPSDTESAIAKAKAYQNILDEKNKLSDSIKKLTFPTDLDKHNQLIRDKDIDSLKTYLKHLERRKSKIEILAGTYSSKSYRKYIDFDYHQLEGRADFLIDWKNNKEQDFTKLIELQKITEKRLDKIGRDILTENFQSKYDTLDKFSKNNYAQEYVDAVNRYLNDNQVEKPDLDLEKVDTSGLCPGGYTPGCEERVYDELNKLDKQYADRLESQQIINFITTKTDFFKIVKEKGDSLIGRTGSGAYTKETFVAKLNSMSLAELKQIKSLDGLFDDIKSSHESWENKKHDNSILIIQQQKLIASYSLASSNDSDKARYRQFRSDIDKNYSDGSVNYRKNLYYKPDISKINTLEGLFLGEMSTQNALEQIQKDLSDIKSGIEDIDTRISKGKGIGEVLDAFVDTKMNDIGKKYAEDKDKPYVKPTKKSNINKFKLSTGMIINSMKTKLKAMEDLISSYAVKEKYQELMKYSNFDLETMDSYDIEKFESLYEDLLDEFKEDGAVECEGMCKYIDSWMKNPNSGNDGNSFELDAGFVFTEWASEQNPFTRKKILYNGGKAAIHVAISEWSSGLEDLAQVYELGNMFIEGRNTIRTASIMGKKLVRGSQIIETYLNYEPDSNIANAIRMVNSLGDSIDDLDSYVGGDSTVDLSWSKITGISEELFSNVLSDQLGMKPDDDNRATFNLESFFLLSAIEGGKVGKDKAVNKLGEMFNFFSSDGEEDLKGLKSHGSKSDIINLGTDDNEDNWSAKDVLTLVTKAQQIIERGISFGEAGEYLFLGHSQNRESSVDEFYDKATVRGAKWYHSLATWIESDENVLDWHTQVNIDPKFISSNLGLSTKKRYTRAQRSLKEIQKRNRHNSRNNYIGIDNKNLDEIDKNGLKKEMYMKKQVFEIIGNLDSAKRFIRYRQRKFVEENYNKHDQLIFDRYLDHFDSESTIPEKDRLSQTDLNKVLKILNNKNFISIEQIFNDKNFNVNINQLFDNTDDITWSYSKGEEPTSINFNEAVFLGLHLEKERGINLYLKNPISDSDIKWIDSVHNRGASNLKGLLEPIGLGGLVGIDYNEKTSFGEGVDFEIPGLKKLDINTLDIFGLGDPNIIGIDSISIDGEIRFKYRDDKERGFFGEYGKHKYVHHGKKLDVRTKYYQNSKEIKNLEDILYNSPDSIERSDGIPYRRGMPIDYKNAPRRLLDAKINLLNLEIEQNKILEEHSIKLTRGKDNKRMERMMEILGITGESKTFRGSNTNTYENEIKLLEDKGLKWCDNKKECNKDIRQVLTFNDNDGKSHEIIIKGDIFYKQHNFYENEVEIDVTTDDWDSLVKLKEYLFDYQ